MDKDYEDGDFNLEEALKKRPPLEVQDYSDEESWVV